MDLPIQLQDGEQVIQVIRRHPASLWGRLALIALVIVVTLIIWLSLGGSANSLSTLLNIVFALVTTYFAGYFPSRKAGKIDPVEIIRGK